MSFLSRFKSNSLLKSGINYSIVGTLRSISTMLVGILIMRWLSPSELGLWNAVSIFLAYLPFFHLGVQSALNIELPILLGKKDDINSRIIVKNSKGFSYLLFGLFLTLGIIITFVLFVLNKKLNLICGIATISIMAAFQSLQLHLIATFRSAKAFNKLALIYFVNTLFIIGLIYFIYKFQYYGVLLYNILCSIIVTFLLYLYAPYKALNPLFEIREIIRLAKKGVVLMSFIQIRELAKSLPKWIILYLGGTIKLGLFAPALAVNGLMNMLPSQIAQFFHPQMGFKYGQSGKASDMWIYIKKIVIIFPLVSIPVCAVIWFTTPWLLTTFFPNYVESEWSMKIMAVAFIFSSAFTTHGVLYTIKAYKQAYFYSFIEIAGYIILPILMNKLLEYDLLTNISIGLAINNFGLYILNVWLLKKVLFLPNFNLGIK